MEMTALRIAPFVLLSLCLGGASPSSLTLWPAPRAIQGSVVFQKFTDPQRFSRNASLVGFRHIDPGTAVDQPMGSYGVALRLGRGAYPTVWMDPEPRCHPPTGAAALTNAGAVAIHAGPRRISRGGTGGIALTATFEVPVNRVAFELRGLDVDELNLIVHALARGTELGSLFFETDEHFAIVGVESSQPFDELRLELTNPDHALLSLDNLTSDLDLRDFDRDGWPDLVDVCPRVASADRTDSDGDGIGDACDIFPLDSENDADRDGIAQELDNCPRSFNPDQADGDRDGIGDVCDDFPFGSDLDNDGVGDLSDNCPSAFNPEQADCDLDGLGDACDPTLIHPSAVSFQLRRGDCVSVQKSVCLPPAPPVIDVLIAFDVTGSMLGEIRSLRQSIVEFIQALRSSLPRSDIRFGLVSFRDYPGAFSSCRYAGEYALPSDVPFRIDAAVGSSDQEVQAAVNRLRAGGGQDYYEAYSRALWEVSQPDSGIGFRPGAARFVLLVGDSGPHDCSLSALLPGCVRPQVSSGRDPGRDGILRTSDDLDYHTDALQGLIDTHTKMLVIFTGLGAFCAWEEWAGLTGGLAIRGTPAGELPPVSELVQRLVGLIRHPIVDKVTFQAENPSGLELRFDPPEILGPIDVITGGQITVDETICVPSELPPGQNSLDCQVSFFTDGFLLGTQDVHVEVGCALRVLDFETEDDFATRIGNGQSLSTPPEFGRLVRISSAGANLGPATFDSTKGGPNDPSINSDMLIGHGNLLLLQDSARPQQNPPGFFRSVTDDPDGGDLIFDFVAPADPRSLLLADINPPPNLGTTVTLFDGAGKRRIYAIDPGWTGTYGNAGPHRLDLTTLLPQPGNGTPRWARATQDPGFRQTDVRRIVVHLTGYGAIDELTFCQ